ncbi:MAG: M48 family metallopeptidase [Clostridia bacterium]|nr:M48 family metallopeptidase [Clostridia bacterium]MBQ4618538.1 M48 family metallopeptidase [Clostridia bacterium]
MKRIVKKDGKALEYTLICSANRKNVLLQALPEGKVRVYAPKNARLREMDKLVLSRWEWIINMHASLDLEAKKAEFDPENGVLIEGKKMPLMLHRAVKAGAEITDGTLHVYAPSLENARIEAEIKKYLARLALDRIRLNLDRYAPTVGREYGRVTIREQKTRWGSCSSRKNLNFNWKLIMAPKEALTYVVIHELCHLIHFNHSEKFWQEVSARMPEYDIWRKWLRANGSKLNL